MNKTGFSDKSFDIKKIVNIAVCIKNPFFFLNYLLISSDSLIRIKPKWEKK